MLTIKDAAAAINDGITRRQIAKWLERDLLGLPHLKTGSQGVPARFTDYDLCYLALVNSMVVNLFIPVKDAAGIVEQTFHTAGMTPQTEDLLTWLTSAKRTFGLILPYRGRHVPFMMGVDASQLFVPVLERAKALREKRAA